MPFLVILFAGLMVLAGLILVANPATVFGFLKNNANNLAIHVMAVVVRLVIGALLVSQSSVTRFPLTIEVLGWIFIIAGLVIAVIGRNTFRRLMSWVLKNFRPFGRPIGILAIVFGGFLIYAFR